MSNPAAFVRIPLALLFLGTMAASTSLRAATAVPVPNASFELPVTPFVDTRVDYWQKTPKPDGYQETAEFTWDQLCGVFLNTAPTNSSHIDNLEGAQALYLFAVPQVGVFQDYNSLSGTNTVPTQAFAAKFEPGKSYTLTVGVVGGGGGMTNGASLQIAFYYRQGGTNLTTVAATNIVFTPEAFPTTTHLMDYQLTVPPVQPGDAWAGQYIGIQIVSTVDPTAAGGYWDIDNVRLEESILVPNGSFELPVTPFVDTRVDYWQKTPKPDGYQETAEFTWDQLCGVFLNTAPTNSSHIDNLEGSQALYLFAVPQVGVFQDYSSLSGTNTVPTQAFAAKFEPGKSYTLTVGVVGGGGGMTNGASLQIAFYYRQGGTNLTTVAATNIVFTPEAFPTTTHLMDYQLTVPPVQPGDAWAGQYIGIQIVSTVDPTAAGGYWDLDNVRLTSNSDAAIVVRMVRSDNNLRLSWPSKADQQYQLESSPDLRSWQATEPAVTGTGAEVSVTITPDPARNAFFRVRAQPKP